MMLPRIFRVRYTLRALFVFITLFALWGGYHANRAYREKKAAAILESAGAKLESESQATIWPYRFVVAARGLQNLDQPQASALAELPFLKELAVTAPRSAELDKADFYKAIEPRRSMSPGLIEHVLAGARLTSLRLDGWILADSTCAVVGRHKTLQELTMISCALSEHGLATAAEARKLNGIRVIYCAVATTESYRARGSTSLTQIEISGTPVSANFAGLLVSCPRLKRLTAGAFPERADLPCVDDEFVSRLSAHPSVEFLDLSDSRITTKSIPAILEIPSLRTLILPDRVEAENRELLAKRFGKR